MPSTLQLRAITCASWTTSFKICTWKTWTSLMRCVSCGSQINRAKFHCLPVPAGTARAAGTDGPGPVADSSLTLADHRAAGSYRCWWRPWPLHVGKARNNEEAVSTPSSGPWGRQDPPWVAVCVLLCDAWPFGNVLGPRLCCDEPWSMLQQHHVCLYFCPFMRSMEIIITATVALVVKSLPTTQET